MSKILEGMSKTNVNEGPAGAVIGGVGGWFAPEIYNLGAKQTGILPTVDPNSNEFGVPLDTITGVTGSVMGHNTQNSRKARRDANIVAAGIEQYMDKQAIPAAAPAPSNAPKASPTTPPTVGSTKKATVSAVNKIPDIIASAPTKKIALATLAAYLANKGVEALTGKSLVDRLISLGDKRTDIQQGLADFKNQVKKIIPGTGNQTNPDVDCKPDASGRLPAGCGRPALENAPSILQGMLLAEESFKAKLLKGAVKGYDWLHDLYLKSIGQTTKKDRDDWYKQHGDEPASVILRHDPSGGVNAAKPITWRERKGWEPQEPGVFDNRAWQRTAAGTLAGFATGGIGSGLYFGPENTFKKSQEKDTQTKPAPAPRDQRRAAATAAKPDAELPVDELARAAAAAEPDAELPVAPPPAPAASQESCVINGDSFKGLSPEECDRMRKNYATNESIVENTSNLIYRIARDNNLKNPDLIRIGQKLRLPGDQVYTVKSGDNLTKIAKALLSQPSQTQSEPMQTVTISAPRISQKYPDSGLPPDQKFSDPRNNPGNIKFFKNLNQPGYVLDKAIGSDNGFAVFATPEDGLDAMRRQIAIDARKGKTGRQFIKKYAPPEDKNNPEVYIQNVFGELGIDPDQPLDPALIPLIQPLMIRQEHGKEGMYYYMPKTDPRNKVAGLNEMEILQRFLDRELEKNKKSNEKPVGNPNAVPKKSTEPKEPGTTDYSLELELDPSIPAMHHLERDRPKIDAEVQKRMQQLQKQKPVTEVKADLINKVIGTGRYIVFNQTTGLRLQTNDVNKAINAAQLMAKKDLNRPTMVYDKETKFPVAAYRGSEEMLQQRNIRHESKAVKKK